MTPLGWLLIALIVIAVIVYAIPLDATVKKILNAVCIVLAVAILIVVLMQVFHLGPLFYRGPG